VLYLLSVSSPGWLKSICDSHDLLCHLKSAALSCMYVQLAVLKRSTETWLIAFLYVFNTCVLLSYPRYILLYYIIVYYIVLYVMCCYVILYYRCVTVAHSIQYSGGTTVAQWLSCCATNQKVAGLIPDGFIGIFHCHNPSDCTMALGST